jgi:hypothetical protein
MIESLQILFDVFVGLILAGVFFVGLGVRAQQLLTGRGGRAGRERDTHDRQARLTVRRPAEGVPVITTPELPTDHDPAISVEDD